MTPCHCPQHGYCPRHGCNKPLAWWKLCRTREDYFQLWEEGRGPGQGRTLRRGPSLTRCVWNYCLAVWRHLRNRRLHVSRNAYRHRLEVCRSCASFEPNKRICLEQCCGCLVEDKARWASEACPLHKWEAEHRHRVIAHSGIPDPSLQEPVAVE